MSDRVAGRMNHKSAMQDSGAEVSTSTTSSEPESGSRSVSSIVRQWNRKINTFLGDPPSTNGTRTIRSDIAQVSFIIGQAKPGESVKKQSEATPGAVDLCLPTPPVPSNIILLALVPISMHQVYLG